MKILSGLKFMYGSRGIKQGIRRLFYIGRRFGITPGKQLEYIEYYAAVLKKHNLSGTFFIPATLFFAYRKAIKNINAGNIEWGIHCDRHTDLSRFTKELQKQHIHNAVAIFDKMGVSFKSFRAPYLKTNDFTLKAISEEERFIIDSSKSILWDEVYTQGRPYYDSAMNFYKPLLHSEAASLPGEFENMACVPVSLPDDDMLVDRGRLSKEEVLSVWQDILKLCYEKEEIFVLQLHPERIRVLGQVLDSLITYAKSFDPPIWITTLSQVGAWENSLDRIGRWPLPYRAAFCITGDIDCLTILDFFNRLRMW